MVTKWKKLSINTAIVYVVSVSLLLVGVLGILNTSLLAGGMRSVWSGFLHEDYQEGTEFSQFISYQLDNFLCMACGDYVGGYVYGEEEGDIVYEESTAILQGAIEDNEDVSDYSYSTDNLSKTEKIKSANNYHSSIKADKNLLYRIFYEGKELYSNMDGVEWNGDENQLPSGYNFYFCFDGTKASVKKDGKELDLYGDGIYREGEDWRIPGFQNFTVKEKWKKAKIVMLAAKEPVLYADTIYYDSAVWQSNEVYYIYQNYKETRLKFQKSIAYAAAGMILFALYCLLKKEKGEAGKYFAKFTGHLWFEWKVLLFLILPVFLVFIYLQKEVVYISDYAQEIAEAGIGTWAGAYISELYDVAARSFGESMIWTLTVFWLFYLFFCDLRYHKNSYKNGCIGKMAALYSSRNLTLPLAKQLVKRTYGIFFSTVVQLMLSVFLLISLLYFGYRSYFISADGWVDSYGYHFWLMGIFAAVSLAALILCMEYFFQKKNKEMAEDLEHLSDRISGIHQGTYESTENFEVKDANVKKMAEELDEIRQGLETAVEERTRSERMKVELIANVSHDIKTPLTSIISYIQLLKQEEGLPDYILDYIRILDEKSERLKNMVQDVFTVSKAASGQLSVDLEELDLGKLLYQTMADMDEVIQNSPVTIKTEIPQYPVMVLADGQRMYRVFQNLIANAMKYSLEGSRVYIALKEEGEYVSASVKNTSSQELNHDTDFAERFTRGDKSRTDGGSGLGLSIAKSFTEACKGTFRLETIADLFVVTITFRRVLGENGGKSD